MNKRMTDRERLKLAMDQPDTIGGTDWIGWLEIVIREMNKDADHIRDLETRLSEKEQEVERLREALADAENRHRTSDQWRSHYQTNLARLENAMNIAGMSVCDNCGGIDTDCGMAFGKCRATGEGK